MKLYTIIQEHNGKVEGVVSTRRYERMIKNGELDNKHYWENIPKPEAREVKKTLRRGSIDSYQQLADLCPSLKEPFIKMRLINLK